MKKRPARKSKLIALLEYIPVYLAVRIAGMIPLRVTRYISSFLGNLLYFMIPRRRQIAIENLQHALGHQRSAKEIEAIARQSCQSVIHTFLEMIKFHFLFQKPGVMDYLRAANANLDRLFAKAKQIHDEAGGAIFVTPHFGNWEILPHVSASAGIPLVVVARPLDNPYLEKLLLGSRTASGQILIPKRNALFMLQKTLQKGRSIGLLPDQRINRGISIDFFGRPAWTNPVPAILAITYQRPIIVVACWRKADYKEFEGYVSDPIRPGEYSSEKAEIYRLTEEVARCMEGVIEKNPAQYLWIHNRWKSYAGDRQVLS